MQEAGQIDATEASRAHALAVYQRSGACFPLIASVLHGTQRGQMFVDSNTSSIFVAGASRFTWAVESNDGLDGFLPALLASPDAIAPRYLLWYDPPARWAERLDAQPDKVRRRPRVRWRLPAPIVDKARAEVSTRVEVRLLDAELAERTSEVGIDLSSFWSTKVDFLTRGVGVCLLVDGRMASLCYAACVADRLAEVDIVTAPEHRGHGYAQMVGERFIDECRDRDLEPTWDCFLANEPSMRLAKHLGFEQRQAYDMYSFNLPLTV